MIILEPKINPNLVGLGMADKECLQKQESAEIELDKLLENLELTQEQRDFIDSMRDDKRSEEG